MEKATVRVLLVDDDEDDYIMTRDMLSEVRGRIYELEWASSYDSALKLVQTNKHDIYLFDYRLGKRTGIDLLNEAVAGGCRAPIILLTGQGDQDIDMEAMKAGAADYLCKNEINANLLERSIRYAMKHKDAEERILHMAYYDNLTNLPNRTFIGDMLKQALSYASRHHTNLAVLFLDLDNFKRINDTLEHRIGDLLLKGVAERLSRYLRTTDIVSRQNGNYMPSTVARLGGDEFVLLLTELTSLEGAAKVAQRILDTISAPFELDGHEVFVTGSIGIAVYPFDGEEIDGLLKNADTAMYHAKELGRNNFQFFKQSMNDSLIERLNLENRLRKAIDHGEFSLYYQPRMDIGSEKISGTEALIRWKHPEQGLILPEKFLPLAEETGLIIPICEWVLNTAVRQNSAWQKHGALSTRMSVSINLSDHQFRQGNFIDIIEKALAATGLPSQYLELEITENIIMKNAEATIRLFHQLKDTGIRISMDNFGTGYSSFNYLKRFPLDIIKIDRSFIKDAPHNQEDAAIVRAIIAMAHAMKLKVIAEGVETKQQLDFLRSEGCDEAQGYLISNPLPAEKALEFLCGHNPTAIKYNFSKRAL